MSVSNSSAVGLLTITPSSRETLINCAYFIAFVALIYGVKCAIEIATKKISNKILRAIVWGGLAIPTCATLFAQNKDYQMVLMNTFILGMGAWLINHHITGGSTIIGHGGGVIPSLAEDSSPSNLKRRKPAAPEGRYAGQPASRP